MAPAPRRTEIMIELRMVSWWIAAYMVVGWWILVVSDERSVSA